MAKALIEQTWIAGSRDRLPWHRAQLYYDPSFLATPSAWAKSVTALAERISGDARIRARPDFHGFEGLIRFDRLQLTVDAVEGILGVEEWSTDTEHTPSTEWEGIDRLDAAEWVGPSGTLRELPPSRRTFPDLLRAERPPAHLLAEFQSAVLPFADAFCASIERRFERALRDGCAQLQGKFRSLAEHFSRIEPPELRHLRFDEKPARESDEFDTGFAGNDRLFSFSVVPSGDYASTVITGTGALNERASDRRSRHDWKIIDPVIMKHFLELSKRTCWTQT